MNRKKLVALIMVLALAFTTLVGGTLAYFTDSEQQTNEFTIGNIGIDLYESVEHLDGLGESVIPEGVVKTDLGKGTDRNPGFEYADIMPSDTMEKIVTVENTGDFDAYIALVVKQENYLNFNNNIDEYYEKLPEYGVEAMQDITDDVFPGWNLLYDKTQIEAPKAQVRYTIDTLPECGDGVEVLGVGYAQENADMSGVPQYHYSGEYFTNGVGMKTVPDGEPDFFTISDNGAHDRVWIIYLKVEAGKSFTIDLTTVCPTYFDNNSVNAFEGMALDVKAFAIQAKGLEPATAFAEALKPGFGF